MSFVNNFASLVVKDNDGPVISAFERGSEVLKTQQHPFAGMLSKLYIYSVLEEANISLNRKVVENESASLRVEDKELLFLPADHSNIVKFKSTQEICFRRVAGALKDLVDNAFDREAKQAQTGTPKNCEALTSRYAEGIGSLY